LTLRVGGGTMSLSWHLDCGTHVRLATKAR
jgi:hypothetical protein